MPWQKTAAVIILSLICFGTCRSAAGSDLEGLPVKQVILQDDRGRPWPADVNLLSLTQIKPGDLFSREAVQRGIKFLYLKRLFRDIRVDAFLDDGGVRVEFTFFPIILVNRVVLRGNHSLANREVLAALPTIEGHELREETFPDYRAAIQSRYEDEGFNNVLVNFRVEPTDTPYRDDLYIYVTEHSRTMIENIRFPGSSALTEKELLSVMRNRPGRPLRTNVLLDVDLTAIQKEYTAAGYPEAKPGPVDVRFENGRAFVEIEVTEGPKVSVKFSGNREISDKKLQELILIWSEHEVSEAIIESSVDKIKNAYHDLGYADVNVTAKRRDEPGSVQLFFTVEEGSRVTVDSVRFEGNHALSAKELSALMSTHASSWYRSRPFREDALESDVESISDRYAAAGFLEAEVKPTVARSGGGTKAEILITVTEGPRTVTGTVIFSGNKSLGDTELAPVLKLRTGMPFNELMMDEDRYRLVSHYASKGYLYARVEVEKHVRAAIEGGTAAAKLAIMDIEYRISEGEQVRMGTVVLRGNLSTKDYVILRELEPHTGQPYDYEKILKSQQRVYRYGYFSLAKFEPIHPFEREAVKNMLFTVQEQPAGSVDFGVGYGNLDRLRGFIQISHRNIEGTGRFASVRLEGSDILQRAAVVIQEPWFMGYRNVDSKFLLAWSNSKRINQDTREIYYQTRKNTASYGIERTDGRLKTSLTYQYEAATNYNVKEAATLTPEDRGHVLISSISPAVVWDLRDDPFNPTRGSAHGATIKEAMDLLGSKADFTKVTAQTSWYLPVAEYSVLALSARAGMSWPHKDTAEVPINDRFYLGGGTTIRGYIQDAVGPQKLDAQGNLTPTGGSSMIQLNAESRLSAAGGSGIVFFVDAGNVWVGQTIRLDDLRASYGAGLRYATPVGPFRLDYGLKIHRRPGESPGELHFNIGQAF